MCDNNAKSARTLPFPHRPFLRRQESHSVVCANNGGFAHNCPFPPQLIPAKAGISKGNALPRQIWRHDTVRFLPTQEWSTGERESIGKYGIVAARRQIVAESPESAQLPSPNPPKSPSRQFSTLSPPTHCRRRIAILCGFCTNCQWRTIIFLPTWFFGDFLCYNINNADFSDFIEFTTKEIYHEQCNSATVQQCNSATNTGNKLNALLAVLALVAAALATPSAFAYKAVFGQLVGTTGVLFEGDGPTRSMAIANAKAQCRAQTNTAVLAVCDADDTQEFWVSSTGINSGGNELPCITFNHSLVDVIAYYSDDDETTALPDAVTACTTKVPTSICRQLPVTPTGELFNSNNPDNIDLLCDTTGLICADNLFANQDLGECEPCPTGTHGIFNGICEEIAECDTETQIRNENRCETCDFDKTPQNNECVCTDENTLDVEGTCTRILECIGNQIRDPEIPTECMNCGDKTANEERNLCEAACTGDNEIKDGKGDCRTCESDSIPNEANTECLPNCSNHDEYKDTDGFCVQCNTGLVASDNNDSCVAVPAVKTPSSKTGIVLGLVVLGVYAANVFAAPAAAEVAAINWTPSYAFRNNNGNISYSVGSRWTARTDNWRYYWQTTQSGGKFSYGSGMNYNTGIFAATMDSESDSDITDLDISLSATKAAGLWHFNGGYNLDARLSATEKTEMQNRLNIAARYSLDKWILSATANTDGERAAARINYSYRF